MSRAPQPIGRRERNKQDVEAHRLSVRENEEPKDEERTESAEGEDVEGHMLARRAKQRAKQ